MSEEKCPKCGSPRWMKDIGTTYMPGPANSIDGHALYASIRGEKKRFGRARYDSKLRADICADCGHLEWKAIKPEALWEGYQNQPND